MPDVSTVSDAIEATSSSRPMGWLARAGLTARAVVYLLMGWLAILLALGSRGHVDQRGAVTELLSRPFGTGLVIAMAVGFAAYALWRLSEAVFGVTGERDSAGGRLKSAARGIAYAALTVTALSVLSGARGTQAGQQGRIAADVMQRTGGRWLVGAVGVVIVVVGLTMVHEGWSKKFLQYFGSVPARMRRAVIDLGRSGTIARGLVFAVTGVLVVVAAVDAQPAKAGGVDEAMRTLLGQPFGTALVVLLGAGLVLFGVYGLAEARWRRVVDGASS
jgi:hypothetical protein